jgi:hypothetical protein
MSAFTALHCTRAEVCLYCTALGQRSACLDTMFIRATARVLGGHQVKIECCQQSGSQWGRRGLFVLKLLVLHSTPTAADTSVGTSGQVFIWSPLKCQQINIIFAAYGTKLREYFNSKLSCFIGPLGQIYGHFK